MSERRAAPGATPPSAQDSTYEWVRQHIATVPHHTGDFLTEAMVSSALGISRTPVREAFLRLEAEGLLQILPKKGAFVPAISEMEARSLMEARVLIEEWSVRRAAQFGALVVDELDALLAEQREHEDNAPEFIACDRRFHGLLVRTARNDVLSAFYDSLRERQIRIGIQAVTGRNEAFFEVMAEHQAIVDAVRAGEEDAAASATVAHLSATWERLLRSGVYSTAPSSLMGGRK